MGSLVLRPATGEDLHAVLEVGHRVWPLTYGPIAGEDYVRMGLAKWWTAEATIPAIRAGRVTVAELDGQVVGMAAVGPLDGHLALWKLYVLPEQQREGIGRQLIASVIEHATADGYDELQLSYLDGNERAARFYAANGFTEFDRQSSGTGVPDSVWVRLPLNHPADEEQP